MSRVSPENSSTKRSRVRLLLEDDRGQTEPREPALGPLGEPLDVTAREPNVGLSKERVGLGRTRR